VFDDLTGAILCGANAQNESLHFPKADAGLIVGSSDDLGGESLDVTAQNMG
jgi:hypothetical protein